MASTSRLSASHNPSRFPISNLKIGSAGLRRHADSSVKDSATYAASQQHSKIRNRAFEKIKDCGEQVANSPIAGNGCVVHTSLECGIILFDSSVSIALEVVGLPNTQHPSANIPCQCLMQTSPALIMDSFKSRMKVMKVRNVMSIMAYRWWYQVRGFEKAIQAIVASNSGGFKKQYNQYAGVGRALTKSAHAPLKRVFPRLQHPVLHSAQTDAQHAQIQASTLVYVMLCMLMMNISAPPHTQTSWSMQGKEISQDTNVAGCCCCHYCRCRCHCHCRCRS